MCSAPATCSIGDERRSELSQWEQVGAGSARCPVWAGWAQHLAGTPGPAGGRSVLA